MDFSKGETFTLKGVKVKWAHVHQPDTKFEHCWKVDAVLEGDTVKQMKDLGFNVKLDKDGDNILTVKRKCTTKNGTKMQPPRVINEDGDAITDLIGNGSKCDVLVYAKSNPMNAGKTCAYLNGVKVVDLIAYSKDAFDKELPF